MQHYLEIELNELVASDPRIFNFLQEGSLDGMWYWDLQSLEDEWMSPRFWEVLGCDPEQMPHKASAWQDIIFEEDLKTAAGNLEAHLRDPNHPYDQMVRYRHKDGHTVWVRCRGLAIRDAQGTPVRMLGVHNDVTALKSAQQELEVQNTRLMNILQGTNLGTWEWNVQTGETKFNERWAEIIGYTLDELGNTSIETWAAHTHPDDLAASNEKLEAHFKGETDFYIAEARMKHKDGHWIWVLDRGQLITRTEDGEPLIMAGSHIDITRQRRIDRELQDKTRLLEKSNQVARIGTWSYDVESDQLVWGKVTRAIHEVDEDYVPRTENALAFYLEGEDRDMIVRHFQNALSNGEAYDIEVRITTALDNVKWVRSVGVPEMENGICKRVYGVFQDINARKEVEIRNQHLLDVATSQNKRLMNFAHIVSHNLRSHAANFKMLFELMDLQENPVKREEVEEHLRAATHGLSETVEHLNEVVVMSQEVAEDMVPVPLAAAVQSSLRSLSGSIAKAAVQVSIDIPSNLKVMAVRAYLDSVFNNLISNSMRYRSPERTPTIHVEAHTADGKVYVEFTDNGLGIDLDRYRDKVFGMYKTFHRHPEAKGIGLFIVKNQIEAMNGSIRIESEVDRFTTLKMQFDEAD
jgi:PAS domain S-box-containing protein